MVKSVKIIKAEYSQMEGILNVIIEDKRVKVHSIQIIPYIGDTLIVVVCFE